MLKYHVIHGTWCLTLKTIACFVGWCFIKSLPANRAIIYESLRYAGWLEMWKCLVTHRICLTLVTIACFAGWCFIKSSHRNHAIIYESLHYAGWLEMWKCLVTQRISNFYFGKAPSSTKLVSLLGRLPLFSCRSYYRSSRWKWKTGLLFLDSRELLTWSSEEQRKKGHLPMRV